MFFEIWSIMARYCLRLPQQCHKCQQCQLCQQCQQCQQCQRVNSVNNFNKINNVNNKSGAISGRMEWDWMDQRVGGWRGGGGGIEHLTMPRDQCPATTHDGAHPHLLDVLTPLLKCTFENTLAGLQQPASSKPHLMGFSYFI